MDLCYYTAAFCRRVRHHRCGPWGAGQRSGSQGDLGPMLVVWLRRSALAEGSGAPCLCPWPCHRELEGWGKHSGTQGGAGARKSGVIFLRSKPPSCCRQGVFLKQTPDHAASSSDPRAALSVLLAAWGHRRSLLPPAPRTLLFPQPGPVVSPPHRTSSYFCLRTQQKCQAFPGTPLPGQAWSPHPLSLGLPKHPRHASNSTHDTGLESVGLLGASHLCVVTPESTQGVTDE